MISRRRFLATVGASLALVPVAIDAQPLEKAARIGFLISGSATLNAPNGILAPPLRAFREGLNELGFIEGQNIIVEYRFAEGEVGRLPSLAVELIGVRVAVILAIGPAALKAAKGATATVPIVAIDFESDPVAAGYITSLARPGGNITGTFLDQAELSGKWLQLLKEVIPALSRAAVLWDSAAPAYQLSAIQVAGRALRVTLQTIKVSGLEDFEGAFAAAAKNRAQAVVILSSPLVSRSGAELSALATKRRLPTISLFRENANAGCLIAYGPSLAHGWRRLGSLAGRVLQGTRVGDIPVERPTRFELIINLRTAKALGLTIPQSLLLRVDEVVE
jgi:putative ABC transport system substrate-binding protein